ncbi:PASTA domain-containing protein [Sutcliffiella horikoshii]|uniref:PASTA domain-containing protein n=1 Tax=Sutcliffiella horikoshii TaxID=79883 RepID=UPI00203CEAB8|nr:PASTA domain-containing protein [Sutcliffiella horikoshii]MCM3618344.1 PASTA domain-containing protein [Sutcliffiella horikoshii]
MSDFLSKFGKDNYDKLENEQKSSGEKNEPKAEEKQDEPIVESAPSASSDPVNQPAQSRYYSNMAQRDADNDRSDEEVEVDPDYRRKKRRKQGFIIAGSVLAAILLFFIYYQMVHVKMEDFVGKPVSEARTWTTDNDLEMELTQEYSTEYEENQIISQSVPEKDKVRKGKKVQFVSSKGADPEDVIPLPDFSQMSQPDIVSWIEENHAKNLKVVYEFSETIKQGEFIRMEIRDSNITAEEYKRKDSAAVYLSKGEEVFAKDITVPDFSNKPKEEVEQWAKTNMIEMEYEEEDSNTIEANLIISQSVKAEEKVAKKDQMKVKVSLGKATLVPNFGELTPDEASEQTGLTLSVKQKFHSDVSYGKLISQSVEAGTKLMGQEETAVNVVYSLGRPYLRDYRGQLDGDLPRLFYEDYHSKGANVNYIVKYVDSPEVKGTIVGMSAFNQFINMTYTVEVQVSNNDSVSPISVPVPDDMGEGE